uniref:Glycosyltransferase family 92 protein n=1 Tax=Meloidogyne hapla TaxID=6305 RepID=A0A1I8BUQ4_MELHA
MFSIPIRQLFCSICLLLILIIAIFYLFKIDQIEENNIKRFSSRVTPKELIEEELDERNNKLRNELNQTIYNLVEGMPIEDEHWCERMINGDLNINETKRLKEWKFNEENFIVDPPPDEDELNERIEITKEDDKCLNLQKLFLFHNKPLSEEEKQYPLAYAMVTHKSVIQTMTMVSSVYQPQNAYCIVVDDKSSDSFLKQIQMLADCFDNIFVLVMREIKKWVGQLDFLLFNKNVGTIQWCKYGVVRAVFTCLKHLTEKTHNWRYLQMVRIFKQLNGTINADVLPFENYRVRLTHNSIEPPLTLWKSSLSALISREAANIMVKSDKVKELLNYLQYTWCSDESLWATIAGNPEELKIPGGFDARSLYNNLIREADRCITTQKSTLKSQHKKQNNNNITAKTPISPFTNSFKLSSFYISRYQIWNQKRYKHPITRTGKQFAKCNGKFVKESCVFGVDDMPNLIRRPELVAHKMYMDFEPAGK